LILKKGNDLLFVVRSVENHDFKILSASLSALIKLSLGLEELFIIVTVSCLASSAILILHNEELNDLYSSPNFVGVIKLRRMRWVGHVARMEEWRVVYRVLVGKPEGKRPLGRPRHIWDDNIKKDL
jgi:hypothetical protein